MIPFTFGISIDKHLKAVQGNLIDYGTLRQQVGPIDLHLRQRQEQDFFLPQRLFEQYIQPAIKSSAPLVENVTGNTLLQSYVKKLAQPY